MEPTDPPPGANGPPPGPETPGPLQALIASIRSRIISGLIVSVPIVLTFWILYWLYATLQGLVLGPMAWLYRDVEGRDPSPWWDNLAAPLIAVVLILSFLYFLGLSVRFSLLRAVDGLLLRVPIVTTLYKALSNVARALGDQMQNSRPQRVVLVEFPHPGMKALAFVTNSLWDAETNKTILCVCVLTGVVPPAGFTLFVPEEAVTEVGWTVNQSLQAIVSGGITTPASIHFFNGRSLHAATGPIVDSQGHPIEHLEQTREPAAH